MRLPGELNKLVSETDTLALVMENDKKNSVQTMYPVLPLVYLPPEDVEARVKSVIDNPS